MSVLERLLRELGIGGKQFAIEEQARFDLSPRAWLESRLHAAGWVRREEAERMVREALNYRQPVLDGVLS